MKDTSAKLPTLEDILTQRGKIHGKYIDNATRTCDLIDALGPKYHTLPKHVRFGIYMICGKLARIVSGDPTFDDHWNDIAGYATKTLETFALTNVEISPNVKHTRTGLSYTCSCSETHTNIDLRLTRHVCRACGRTNNI